MNTIFKKKRNSKFRSATKKTKRKLFIKDIGKIKFKKRKNKSFLKFLQFFDLRIDKNNIVYIYVWGILVLLGLIGFVMFGPYFQIQTINIARQDNLSNINIAYKSLETIRWTHIIQNDRLSVERNIKNYQENIKTVSLSRKWPNKLDITIWSYEPIFNTTINKKNYIILSNGSFIPEKNDPNLKQLRIISNKRSSSIPDYKKVIDKEYMDQINTAYKEIKTNIIRIQIEDMSYYPVERELILGIEGWAQLIFDLGKPITPQVKRLAVFDTENIKIDIPSVVYIDLRIKNKVFYCTTETEYQCVINLKNIYPENIEQEQ